MLVGNCRIHESSMMEWFHMGNTSGVCRFAAPLALVYINLRSPPLLHPHEVPPGAVCPSLEYSSLKRHGAVG